MTHWQQLCISTTQDKAERISTWLEDHALSVTITDSSDQPLYQEHPQDMPLWQAVHIEALFADDEDINWLIQHLKQDYPTNMSLTVSQLSEQDWVRLTQSQFPAQCFADRLWIIPSWQDLPQNALAVVRIDPGLAFGTGTHATTAMCLNWLASQQLSGQSVIDYGCGSGILALATLALDAAEVYAVDHDPQALLATQNNANLNAFIKPNQLHIVELNSTLNEPVDLVIANILAKPLCELAAKLSQLVKPQCHLLLSGLLTTEINSVFQAYANDFSLDHQQEREEWACLLLKKKS